MPLKPPSKEELGRLPSRVRRNVKDLYSLSPNTRAHAARRLGETGYRAAAAIPYLAERVSDPWHDVSYGAVVALSKIAHPDAIPFLGEALNSKDENIPFQAAVGLGRTKHPDAIPFLVKALEGSRSNVNMKVIADALGKIGKKILEENPNPTPKQHFLYATKLISPKDHPRAFARFYRDLQNPKYAKHDEKFWKFYAKELRALHGNVK